MTNAVDTRMVNPAYHLKPPVSTNGRFFMANNKLIDLFAKLLDRRRRISFNSLYLMVNQSEALEAAYLDRRMDQIIKILSESDDHRGKDSYIELENEFKEKLKEQAGEIEQLKQIIKEVEEGESIPKNRGENELIEIPDVGRDRQIVKLWNDGSTAKQIAERFSMAERTIYNKITALRKKHPDRVKRKNQRDK